MVGEGEKGKANEAPNDGDKQQEKTPGGGSEGREEKERACLGRPASAWLALAFGVLAIAMAVGTVWVEWRAGENTIQGAETVEEVGRAAQTSASSLAGLLLFGVLTFFFAIAALVALMQALGLASRDTALGMPQGSIRAFMALVLIMLFFLMAVFLYLDVARTGTERRVAGISQQAYEQIVADGQVIAASTYSVPDPDNPGTDIPMWDVVLRATRERSQVAEEMARQLITVLGTLIVAIAAFYFGANSVQKAWHDESKQTAAEGLGTQKTRIASTPG